MEMWKQHGRHIQSYPRERSFHHNSRICSILFSIVEHFSFVSYFKEKKRKRKSLGLFWFCFSQQLAPPEIPAQAWFIILTCNLSLNQKSPRLMQTRRFKLATFNEEMNVCSLKFNFTLKIDWSSPLLSPPLTIARQ